MASVYTQSNKWEAAFDPERCKASVHEPGRGVRIHQCLRKPKRDGWCEIHHPDTEKQREYSRDARYEAQQKANAEAAERRAVALLRELGYTVTPPKDSA
jgi:hypothetical protein